MSVFKGSVFAVVRFFLIPAHLQPDTFAEVPVPARACLSLALLVLCVFADHPHHAAARNDLALDANLFLPMPGPSLLAALLCAQNRRGMLFELLAIHS